MKGYVSEKLAVAVVLGLTFLGGDEYSEYCACRSAEYYSGCKCSG